MHDEEFDAEEQNAEESSFAELLEENLPRQTRLEPGVKIEATILQIGTDWSFLDVGQKGEGVIATAELVDTEGEPAFTVGDNISVYFLSREGGELRFTRKIGGSGSGTEQLEEAWRSGIPVEGRIEKEIKGGVEVKLAGNIRAFCPYSQTGQRQGEPADLIGQTLSFKITQFGERGRNIIVSHRAILDEQREQQRASLRETLKEGMVVKGTVTNIREFGAFVDIGGVEGLLPISEISYGRVEDINELLRTGQDLEVAIKKIDWDNNKFSFSLRDTLADPWSKVGTIYQVGGSYPGKVCRLAQFGAFVTLEEGIDGLVHISKLSDQRIRHPQDVVKIGQSLQVTIEKIDQEQRRISLVPAGQEQEAEETSYSDLPSSSPTGFGSLGDLLKASRQKKERSGKKRR